MNIKRFIIFAFAAFLLIASANSWNTFNLHPASVHQWRQSDCASYVKTFYRNHTNVLTPGTYNLAGKEGRVASEFPIIYYAAAKIQMITGEHYWVIRGLTFLCYLLGLMALLGCIRKWIPQQFYAAFSVIILATSPYYYYYALNFLPNIPAISLSFIGLFFLLNYDEREKIWLLIVGMLSFTLAMLLKPTDGGILFVAYILAKVFDLFFSRHLKHQRKKIVPLIIGFIFIAIVNIIWVKYVDWYNDVNGNHQNLIGIYPIWDMNIGLIKYTAKRVITEWSNVFQQKAVLGLLAIFFVIYILKWRQLNQFLKRLTLFLFWGILGYSLLWFKAFTDHDYYQLPLVLPAVFLSITIMEYYVRDIRPKINTKLANGILACLLIIISISVYHNRNIQHERYTDPKYVYINPALYEIEPYLLKIGIGPQDHVVCVPDPSPNISLNAINRYGYTEEFNSESYNIYTFKAQGARYLIISDSSYLDKPLYVPFEKKWIGEYKGIYIFDIKDIMSL
jgi:hypothetical protein